MLGRTLGGRYEIIEHLGSGGFSETYLARDRQLPLMPLCVVKQLPLHLENSDAIATAKRLFDTEARLLYDLSQKCDQVPRLLAHFQENEDFFLIQEYIEGQDLTYELSPDHPFSEAQVIQLLQDVLHVLKYVHDEGVIHQDIKPRNLMRCHQDGKIVLLDFGAVKQITQQLEYPATPNFTSSTLMFGTPAYMSNEQQGGKPRFNSDIFSVGMVALQAVTGLHPSQLHEDFETGEVIWRDLAPQISDRLAAILTRMVKSHFRDRYQSATEVLQAIDRFQQGEDANPTVPPHQSIALFGQLVGEPNNSATSNPATSNPGSDAAGHHLPLIYGNYAVADQFTPVTPINSSNGTSLQIPAILEFPVNSSNSSTPPSVKTHAVPTQTHAVPTQTHAVPTQTHALSSAQPDRPSPDQSERKFIPGIGDGINRKKLAIGFVMLGLGILGLAAAVLASVSPGSRIGRWDLSHLNLTRWHRLIFPDPHLTPADRLELASTLSVHKGPVFAIVISPDGKYFYSGSGDRTIRQWSMATGALLRTFYGHTQDVAALAISADGSTLVSGARDNQVKVWQIATGKLLHTLQGHKDWIRAVAISPNQQMLASGGVDHEIRIWHLPTGKLLHVLKGHKDEVEGLAITPDGQSLISGSEDESIKIWDLSTGTEIRSISGNGQEVEFIALAPDGMTLVGGGERRTYIWNLTNGDVLRSLPEQSGIMRSVVVSPDDQTLVGTYQDNTLKLWNLQSGKLLKTLPGHTDWVLTAAISPDGQTVLSGGRDNHIKIWRAP